MILEVLGYDPDMLGQSRVTGVQINIKKQAESEGGFTEGKSHRRKKSFIVSRISRMTKPS